MEIDKGDAICLCNEIYAIISDYVSNNNKFKFIVNGGDKLSIFSRLSAYKYLYLTEVNKLISRQYFPNSC